MTTLFKQAHALTRTIIQPSDSYSATFTLCLRHVIAMQRTRLAEHSLNATFEAIGYRNDPLVMTVKLAVLFIVIALSLYGIAG